MIKQSIKYEDADGVEVTRDFWFHLSKKDLLEMELETEGGLRKKIEDLTKTSAGKEAYYLFKDILLSAYGRRVPGPDGAMEHLKRDPMTGELYRNRFEQHPALSELIFAFMEDGDIDAAKFVRGLFPASIVSEVEIEAAKKEAERIAGQALGGSSDDSPVPVAPEPLTAVPDEKKVEDYSREELLAMSTEEFNQLAGTDPTKMSPPLLQVAFQRKSQQ